MPEIESLDAQGETDNFQRFLCHGSFESGEVRKKKRRKLWRKNPSGVVLATGRGAIYNYHGGTVDFDPAPHHVMTSIILLLASNNPNNFLIQPQDSIILVVGQ